MAWLCHCVSFMINGVQRPLILNIIVVCSSDFSRQHAVSATHVQVSRLHCTVRPILQRPCFVAAAGPVYFTLGFWYDVLEDFPPPSEQAAVMLLQIDIGSIEFWFLLSPVMCQSHLQSSLAQLPLKVCAPVQSSPHSASNALLTPVHKHSLQIDFGLLAELSVSFTARADSAPHPCPHSGS